MLTLFNKFLYLTYFLATLVLLGMVSSPIFAKERRLAKEIKPLQVKTSIGVNDNVNPTIVGEDSAAYGAEIGLFGRIYSNNEGYSVALDYSGDFTRYFVEDETVLQNDDEYDFTNANLRLSANFYLSDLYELQTEAVHSITTEKLGTGISRFREQIINPDVLNYSRVSSTFVYGKENFNRQLFITAEFSNFDYGDNNSYSPLFNYTHATVRAGLKFRKNSRLTYITQVQIIDEQYESNLRLDNVLYSALAGVEWTATGKSFLYVLVGGYHREIENRDPSSSFTWYVTYEYDPREDIAFKFESARTAVTAFDEVAIDTIQEDHIAKAEYFYSKQWKFSASYQLVNSKFTEGERARTLKEDFASLGVQLATSSHNDIFFNIGRNSTALSDNSVDYEQNEVRVTWQRSF
jgi:hypothetical protein